MAYGWIIDIKMNGINNEDWFSLYAHNPFPTRKWAQQAAEEYYFHHQETEEYYQQEPDANKKRPRILEMRVRKVKLAPDAGLPSKII